MKIVLTKQHISFRRKDDFGSEHHVKWSDFSDEQKKEACSLLADAAKRLSEIYKKSIK
jgi:hypothetical protein